MQWYYSTNGQQQGPVSQAELENLVRTGAVGAETFVWREGMPNWVAYRSVLGTAVAAAPVAAGMARCAECGQAFPQDDMVRYEQSHVCAHCKPLFFQKIREGVAVGGGYWRYKKQLVTRLSPVLPARCLKCNAPTEEPQKKRNLYWHNPVFYVAVLISPIIYIIIAAIVRKRTVAMVSVCREHRVKRRNAILIAWLLVLLGLGAVIGGAINNSGWIIGAGAVLFLGGIIYGIVKGRLIYPIKMDKEHVWIGGCDQKFLNEFPEWTGA